MKGFGLRVLQYYLFIYNKYSLIMFIVIKFVLSRTINYILKGKARAKSKFTKHTLHGNIIINYLSLKLKFSLVFY